MQIHSFKKRGVLCAVLALSWAPMVCAQASTDASLNGTVRDATGGAVPNAQVTLTNAAHGLEMKATTTPEGRYSFTLIPPQEGYVLTVEAAGFSSYRQTGLNLAVGKTTELNVQLQLGETTQTVEVSGDTPLLDTEDANIGAEVNQRSIVELPLSTRNLISLLSLDSSVQPGVNLQQVPGLGSLADQDLSFLNFGGQRFGTTAYIVDGMYDTGADWGGVIYTPSVEETAEFRVQSNSYSAQYGWSTGNAVEMVTKSGSRDLHGDVWEFLRNEDLNANSFFANLNGIPRQEFRQNQFGGTLGGPVYIPKLYSNRDKTFFFFSLERINRTTPVDITTTMPLAAWKQGDFSGLLGPQLGKDAEGRAIFANAIYNPFTTRQVTPGAIDPTTGLMVSSACTSPCYIRDPFAGNRIPTSLFDPVAQKLLQYWPSAQNQGSTVNNFSFGGSETAYTQPFDLRIDHNINDQIRLFGKFGYKWVNFNDPPAFFGNSPAGPANGHPNNRLLGGINFVDTISSSSTMSANIGISRWVEGRSPQGAGYLPSQLGLPASLNIAPNFPDIGFNAGPTSVYPLGNNANGNGAVDRWPREDRTFGVDYSKVSGRHTITAGFNFIEAITAALDGNQASFTFGSGGTAGPNPLDPTSETGLAFASFLIGTGQGGSGTVPQLTNAYVHRDYIGGYVQDDFKVTPKLTITAGLRYEIQTSPVERYNQQGWFDYSAVNPVSNMVNPNTGVTVAQMLGHPLYGEEVQAGTNGAGRGLFAIQYNNLAPRFSIAYSPFSKWVVRSGFAIFYVPDFVFPGSGYNAPGFSANSQWNTTQANGAMPASLLSNPFPNGLLQEVGTAQGTLVDVGYGATEGYSHWRPTPYTEQWSVGIQYQATKNGLFDLEYIGNHGLKLPTASLDRDSPAPSALIADQNTLTQLVPNPFYGVITSSSCNLNAPMIQEVILLKPMPQYCGVGEAQAEVASSWYDALQAKFTQRWTGGLQFLASFTWSKYLDNSAGVQGWTNYASQTVPNPYDLRQDKSYDINDIPLAFTGNMVYDIPVGRGRHFGSNMNRVANAIAGGWQISGILPLHDGFPLSVETYAPGGSLGAYNGAPAIRPNVVCNPVPANRSWNNFINPNCFAQPVDNFSLAALGNAPPTEGYFRGPGYVNLDLAVHKNWTIDERFRTEFRAEAFDVANHANFFAPGGGSLFWYPGYTANVANLSNTYPPRNVQLALKLYWQ